MNLGFMAQALGCLPLRCYWRQSSGPGCGELPGLMLSAPLTVCLVVMGKYIPQLEFLSTLLGDKPVLEPKARFYQRLLAMDQEEAGTVLDKYLKENQLVDACDTILIPALGLAEQDRHRGNLDENREKFVLESIGEMIEGIGQRAQSQIGQGSNDNQRARPGLLLLTFPYSVFQPPIRRMKSGLGFLLNY